jgi:hypothetical protein
MEEEEEAVEPAAVLLLHAASHPGTYSDDFLLTAPLPSRFGELEIEDDYDE